MNLHLHLGGKTGEIVYASGAFPAIRQRWPGARLILHIHPHYLSVLPGLRHQPDEVVAYQVTCPDDLLAVQVTACLRREHRARGNQPLTVTPTADIEVLAYGLHQREASLPRAERRPFYALFQAAADAAEYPYERPAWGQPYALPPTSVVVLPTGNIHTGGARQIDIPAAEWARLAGELAAFGLEAVATGHRDDPRPLMPGWRWLETDDPAVVLDELRRAGAVLGLNSGITFAACQIAAGTVTMLDTQGRPEYLFGKMYEGRVLDPMRHLQIPWAVAAEDMIGTVRRALLR